MTRPKKEEELRRSHLIALRLTDAEFELITNTANEAGLTASAYIRKQLLEKQICVKYDIVADISEINILTAEVGKIGNNLNQIARHFNTGGIRSKAMQDEIHDCITKLFSLRKEILKLAGEVNGSVETYR